MPEPALIDAALPRFQFHERHSIEIAAPPDTVWRALHELEAREVAPVRWLMGLRLLPARLLGRVALQAPAPQQRVLDALLQSRFVRLDERPGSELVLGTAGRFWRLAGERGTLEGREAFLRFAEPESARAAMDFRIEALAAERTRLSTETRVETTDEAARRRFRLYWAFVQPGSALIRLVWLRAVKRRAERER